jgi:hypothetical protein
VQQTAPSLRSAPLRPKIQTAAETSQNMPGPQSAVPFFQHRRFARCEVRKKMPFESPPGRGKGRQALGWVVKSGTDPPRLPSAATPPSRGDFLEVNLPMLGTTLGYSSSSSCSWNRRALSQARLRCVLWGRLAGSGMIPAAGQWNPRSGAGCRNSLGWDRGTHEIV